MPKAVIEPVLSTTVIVILLCIALVVSLRKRTDTELFPPESTNEVKGFAMFAIIFAHVGYFLASDTRFLFPLSILAGVGVDLFLLVSGFGLTVSMMKRPLAPLAFYKRHLPKLYAPLWIVLLLFFAADALFLHSAYPLSYMVRSFLGIFPHANLYTDIDSPLWYFTFILFFYTLFPLFFFKRRPLVSAVLLYAAMTCILMLNLPYFSSVAVLYGVHTLAFPVGVALGGLYARHEKVRMAVADRIRKMPGILRICACAALLGAVVYLAYFSAVGSSLEQYGSLLTGMIVLAYFLIKRTRIRFLGVIGFFSYELYLLHWPIMYRYDFLFTRVPAWAAFTVDIVIILGLSWALRKAAAACVKKLRFG